MNALEFFKLMEKLLGVEQLAEYLGIEVSTVYAWVHTRQVPFYKIGRLVKFKASDIAQWLEERKTEQRAI